MLAHSFAKRKNTFMTRYVERENVFNDAERFAAADRMRGELGLEIVEPAVHPESPSTIGIEIEMTWRHAFPDIAAEWPSPSTMEKDSDEYRAFVLAYDAAHTKLSPTLEHIKNVIPRVGSDAYWEFSFFPSKNINVTSAELGILYDAGLLKDGEDYSLHMTVADIATDRDAFTFLCGLEQMGGTTPTRLLEAAESKKGAWARKGTGGLLRRRSNELIGDDAVGYEFRTLVARSEEQVNTLLASAAMSAQLFHDPSLWRDYRYMIESRLRRNGLELKPWGKPKENPDPWVRYAAMLDSIQ
jgi:hypothetical protein